MGKDSNEMTSLCLIKDAPEIAEIRKDLDELGVRMTQQRDFLLKQARDVGKRGLEERNAAWDRVYDALKARFGAELPADWHRENYGISLNHGVVRYRPDRGNKDMSVDTFSHQLGEDVVQAIIRAFAGHKEAGGDMNDIAGVSVIRIPKDGEKPN